MSKLINELDRKLEKVRKTRRKKQSQSTYESQDVLPEIGTENRDQATEIENPAVVTEEDERASLQAGGHETLEEAVEEDSPSETRMDTQDYALSQESEDDDLPEDNELAQTASFASASDEDEVKDFWDNADTNFVTSVKEPEDPNQKLEEEIRYGEGFLEDIRTFANDPNKIQTLWNASKDPKIMGGVASIPPNAPQIAQEAAEPVFRAAQQVYAGLLQGVESAANSSLDATEWLVETAGKFGIGPGEIETEHARWNLVDKIFPEPQNDTQALARRVAQQTFTLLPLSRVIKASTKGRKAAKVIAANAAISGATLDPEEERLANLAEELPGFAGEVAEYLAYDEDESRFEGRVKNMIESLGIDGLGLGLTRGIVSGTKAIKQRRAAQEALRKKDAIEEAASKGELPDALPDDILDGTPTTSTKTARKRRKKMLEKRLMESQRMLREYGLAPDTDFAKLNQAQTVDEVKALLTGHENMTDRDIALQISRRWKVSDSELNRNAARILENEPELEKLLQRRPGEALNAEQTRAIKVLAYRDTLEYTNFKIPENIEDMPDIELLQLAEIENRFLNTINTLRGSEAELARGTRSIGVPLSKTQNAEAHIRYIEDLLLANGGRQNLENVARGIRALQKNPEMLLKEGVKLAKKRSLGKSAVNSYLELGINGYLSNFATHARNIMSSLTMTGADTAETAIARGLSRAKNDGTIAPGELEANALGAFSGVYSGIRAAYHTMKTGNLPTNIRTKAPPMRTRAIEASNFGLDPEARMGKMIDSIGRSAEFFGLRAIRAGDVMNRIIAYNQKTHQLAVRLAHARGLKEGTDKFNRFVKAKAANPPEGIRIEANKHADRVVFANPITEDMFMGKSFQTLSEAIQHMPVGFARVAVPFTRALAGIVDQAVIRTPALAYASPRVRADLAAGGARRNMAQARQVLGGSIMGLGANLAYNGWMTPTLAADYRTRRAITKGDEGYQDKSIRFPDGSYHQTGELGPLTELLHFGADMSYLITNATINARDEKYGQRIQDFIAGASAASVDYITPDFVLQFGDVLEIVEKVANGDISKNGTEKALAKLATFPNPVSNLMRGMRRRVDPVKRDTAPRGPDYNAFTKTLDKIKNEFINTIPVPGFSSGLPAHRNIFNDEVTYPPGTSPLSLAQFSYSTNPETDEIVKEIERLDLLRPVTASDPSGDKRLRLTMPSEFYQSSWKPSGVAETYRRNYSIPYTNEQYARLIELSSGKDLHGFNKPLRTVLNEMVKKDYPQLPKNMKTDQNKRSEIKRLVNFYRKAALSQLKYEIAEDIRPYKQEKVKEFQESFGLRSR